MTGIEVVDETMPRQDEILTGPSRASRTCECGWDLGKMSRSWSGVVETGAHATQAAPVGVHPSFTSVPGRCFCLGQCPHFAGGGDGIWRVIDHIRTNVEACEVRAGGKEILHERR